MRRAAKRPVGVGAGGTRAPQRAPLQELDSGMSEYDEVQQMMMDDDQSSLSKARAQWFFGDWSALAAQDIRDLRDNPERDRFALLVASAHQQLGEHDKARKYTRQALAWGCPPRLVAQILIAGVHNTLGRAAALARNDTKTVRHFRNAVAVGSSPREAELLSHARSVREMAKLGLLPQAASLVDQELAKARKLSERPEQTRARIHVLEVELELLRGDLILALQRQQLYKQDRHANLPKLSPDGPDWLRELRKKSVSQLGQDLWVLEQTGYKRGGFFVEFGATDGVLLSNTWLLEKEFDWNGICAEPNPKFFEQLKKNRHCINSDACIGGETGKEVEFIFADAFGGIADYADVDTHAGKRAAYHEIGRKTMLVTISLHDFLKQHAAPREIDYLSIDTEGSELMILSAFPFEQWNIRLISVEHNFTPQRNEIRKLLSEHGYRCLEHEWDDWYVRDARSQ